MNNIDNANTKRRLWLSPEEFSNLTSNATRADGTGRTTGRKTTIDSYKTVFQQFSSKPPPKSLAFLLSNTVALLQEFVLTCFLLAGHRSLRLEELEWWREGFHADDYIGSSRLVKSLGLIWFTLVVSVVQNRFANSKRYTIRHRSTDFGLMAILLRFLSAVLKTLTASYSSDTVYALSTVSLLLHLLTCDYDYANGLNSDDDDDDDENGSLDCDTASRSGVGYYRKKNLERPTFKGGMVSLTSAFFATTLLASRLESNVAVYMFVCSSVILFALFPAARHLVAVKARHTGEWVPMLLSGILTLALILLLEPGETLMVLIITSFIGIFVPLWKYHLQYYKSRLRGPWDIAHL